MYTVPKKGGEERNVIAVFSSVSYICYFCGGSHSKEEISDEAEGLFHVCKKCYKKNNKNMKNIKNIILLSETGGGKTYTAFKKMKGKRFVALAPCRQLAYEMFLEYGKSRDGTCTLKTGEVNLVGTNGSLIAVYENALDINIEKYDTFFIDEAHFLCDNERGYDLKKLIIKIAKSDKELILATATNSIPDSFLNNYKIKKLKLKPFAKKMPKKKISPIEFGENVRKGMKSLCFTKYRPESVEIYADIFEISTTKIGILDASLPSTERMRVQIAFYNGELDLVVATNVLAQGLNFPAQQVLIETNLYDTPEIIQQKLGRIGRPKIMNGDTAFYCVTEVKEIKKRKTPKKRKEQIYYREYLPKEILKEIRKEGKFKDFQLPQNNFSKLSDIRYSAEFLNSYKDYFDYEYKIISEELLDEMKKEECELKKMLNNL